MTIPRKLAVPTDDTPEERVLAGLIILDLYHKAPPTTSELAAHLAEMQIDISALDLKDALARLVDDKKISRSRRRVRGRRPVQVWQLPRLDV